MPFFKVALGSCQLKSEHDSVHAVESGGSSGRGSHDPMEVNPRFVTPPSGAHARLSSTQRAALAGLSALGVGV